MRNVPGTVPGTFRRERVGTDIGNGYIPATLKVDIIGSRFPVGVEA
jgi:hypothetical protein